MSIELDEVKKSLRVTHDSDDDLLNRLIESATREFARFSGIDDPIISVGQDVFNGMVLMVQADYEGDPLKRGVSRAAAESLWMPYRIGMGV